MDNERPGRRHSGRRLRESRTIRCSRSRGRTVIVLILVAMTTAVLADASPGSAALIASSPPCSGSYDPYSYTESAVDSCGVKTIPLTGKQALPGGGDQYSYDFGNGVTVSLKVPPPGFDVATATSAQLAEYGLPSAPANAAQLGSWMKLQVVPAPPFLVEANIYAGSDLDSKHYAGYDATAPDGTFTFSGLEWYEPSYGYTSCSSPNDTVIWSGIGADRQNTAPVIMQDGTSYGLGYLGIPNHQAWIENYPLTAITALPLNVPQTHFVGAIAQYQPGNNGYAGWVWDFTANSIDPWSVQWTPGAPKSDYYSGDAAAAIVERPGPGNGNPTNLNNFGTVSFTYSAGNGTTLDQFATTSPPDLHKITMYEGSTANFPFIGPHGTGTGWAMTSESAIGSQGSFSVTHIHCN
jgi:hypothetical protein